MAVISAKFREEAQDRYLTYAMSVVSGRALPDVRDGLKPVQRRLLYTMFQNLNLRPSSSFKKSAAVVGNVLAKFHPHGDVACYEAMVRMAQDFSLRYPIVEGQGNFGSLDGDPPAAYRYTEARLREIAISILGEINEETVQFRDNFDATQQEPVVLPSLVPNLLVNGATGIAVGMATSIPPHNLKEICKTLVKLIEDPKLTTKQILTTVKGPDFPTSCSILNTKEELQSIYETGRGAVKMRGEWKVDKEVRGKTHVVISSIPYAINKAQLVEKIADLIISKKLPQVVDIRDESTEDVRIVIEVQGGADINNVMAYICKNTNLETNFNVNLTALVPGPNNSIVPDQLSLKGMLEHFLDFRHIVVRKRLEFEKKNLLARLHILEGFMIVFADLDAAIKIVRRSEGRSDAATKLAKKFKLSEIQAFAIVDMRIYQLARTNIEEITAEYKAKTKRLAAIEKILKSKKKISGLVKADLERIIKDFGDNRRSKIVKGHVEYEIDKDAFVVKEEVYALVTADGWIKRMRQNNEPSATRMREGDQLLAAHPLNTVDHVVFFTTKGNVYSLAVKDFPSSSGYGDPVQKHLRFKDGEKIAATFGLCSDLDLGHSKDYSAYLKESETLFFVSKNGLGYSGKLEGLADIKKGGKRVMRLKAGDEMKIAGVLKKKVSFITRKGYALTLKKADVLERNAPAVGVNLMGVRQDDALLAGIAWDTSAEIEVVLANSKTKVIDLKSIKSGKRSLKGNKLPVKSEVAGVKDA